MLTNIMTSYLFYCQHRCDYDYDYYIIVVAVAVAAVVSVRNREILWGEVTN